MMKPSAWLQQEAYCSTPNAHVSAPVSVGLSDSLLIPCIDHFTADVCTTLSSEGLDVTSSDTTQNDLTKHSNTVPTTCHIFSPTMGNPSASSHSASNLVQVPNSIAPATVLQPPIPELPTTDLPLFLYNVSLNNNTLHSYPPQLKSYMLPVLGQLQFTSRPPPPAAGLEPPVLGQPVCTNYISSNFKTPVMPPPDIVSPNIPDFTFNGYLQLMQKDHALNFATSAAAAECGAVSSVASHPHSALTTSTSNSPSRLCPSNSQVMVGSPLFCMPESQTPPLIVSSVSSFLTASSAPLESSATRPILSSASVPPGSSGEQIIYPLLSSYPSLSYDASFPQGPWLHPPQLSVLPRPPFFPDSGIFYGHVPPSARGMPLPSVPLPVLQYPGVTPVGNFSCTRFPSLDLGHQLVHKSLMQPELPPGTGIDKSKQENDIRMKDRVTVDVQSDVWTAHKTDSRSVYYYNALTGESTYAKPPGFEGQVNRWQISSEVDESRKTVDVGTSSELNECAFATPGTRKGSASTSSIAPAMNTGCREALSLRVSIGLESTSALDLIKRKLQDSASPVIPSLMPPSPKQATLELNVSKIVDCSVKVIQDENMDMLKIVNGDANLSEPSSDSEGANNGPTREECIIHFKEMLKERGVAPFSKWEKELPKIVFDPRFKAVPCYSLRRSLFEHYVKTQAEVERREKRAAQKAAIEGFKKLLDDAAETIDHMTDYHTFKKKWRIDPRFEALNRKERELLFSERVLLLKRAFKEKDNAIRATAASSFKSMLQDKGDLTVNSRWSMIKECLRNDSRYKSVMHEDREVLFNKYIAELKASAKESESLVKAKVQEQDKLKERERELRKRKEREEQEMERVRLKICRKEAVSSFQALLVEKIKDPQASLTESRHILEKDRQGRATNTVLDPSDKEKLFREHIKMLDRRSIDEFKVLLSEVLTKDGKCSLNSWSSAKEVLKADPRYAKTPREYRELAWRRFVEKHKARIEGDDDNNSRKSYMAIRRRRGS